MGIYKFSVKMVKTNFKQSALYLMSIVLSTTIIVNLFNIITNSDFILAKGKEGDIATNIPSDIIFLLILLVCVFTFYANSYFVTSKTREMAIVELCGIWPGKLARMLLFQNAIIEIIGGAIGILIGILFVPVFLSFMYIILGTSGNILALSMPVIWGTVAIVFLQLLYVSLGDFSFTANREIIDLIGEQKKVRSKDVRFIKLNSIIYIIAYFIPVGSLFLKSIPQNSISIGIIDILFTIFSISGILSYHIPEKILALKKKKYSNNKIKLISLSNLYVSLKQLKPLIITLTVIVEMLLCVIGIYKNYEQVKTICICSYITLVILIAVSIIYKIILETDNKKHNFRQLGLIGYTTDQIQKIIQQEFKIFYSITIGITLFHIFIFLILFQKNGILSIGLLGMLLFTFVFVFVFLVTGLVSYNLYKKLLLKNNSYRFL